MVVFCRLEVYSGKASETLKEVFEMEISGKIPVIKIDAYVNNIKEKHKINASSTKNASPGLNEDKVDLSRNINDVKKAQEMMDSISDVNEEKVTKIKDQIEKGTYKVDGKKIAFKMIKNSLIDEIV